MAFSIEAAEQFFKVLGDGSRLRILQAIGRGEASVSEILARTALPQTLASFHLRILREAGVVSSDRRGPFVYYRLWDPSLVNLLEACATYAATLQDGERPRAAEFRWPPWATMCRITGGQRR